MSSLRVDSLRLCWLEAFLAVAEEENISEAANVLDLDQSTVSRYMQALEKWLGKKLILPGAINDPEDARVSVGLTEDGRDFREIAQRVCSELLEFRARAGFRQSTLDSINHMIDRMHADQKRKSVLDVTAMVADNIDAFVAAAGSMDKFSDDELRHWKTIVKEFFNNYTWHRNREVRRKRRKPSKAKLDIPDSFFDELERRKAERNSQK